MSKTLDKLTTANFEMFTTGGNGACRTATKKLVDLILSNKRVSKEQIERLKNEALEKIGVKHKEVGDTEPPQHMNHYINMALKEAGYGFEIQW